MKYHYIWILILFMSLQGCWGTAESSDREECAPAFESNFGFPPPSSIKEIALKNLAFRDGSVHWMTFNYDAEVFKKIIKHDSPLLTALSNTAEHASIIKELSKDNHNTPAWFSCPKTDTKVIFYKKDFLDHTFSEYYLWMEPKSKMVFLYVHYFD